jgi:acyl-CoA thioesterase
VESRLEFLTAGDGMIKLFGMEVDEAGDGFARLSCVVDPLWVNAHNLAHGGVIFALADAAFALAVNSLTDALGVQWSFNLVRSVQPGDRITAECRLMHQGRRLLVVEYTVRRGDGALVAQGQATAIPV